MKIFKSTLAQLLKEAKPPFYLAHSQSFHQGKIPQCCWTVSLSGRNEAGDWCELILQTPAVFSDFANAVGLSKKQAEDWTKELRTRLEALELEVLDGRVGEPMLGVIE